MVSEDWSVAEPTSHQFTYTKTTGPTSAAIYSGNQTAGELVCRFFTEEVWDLIVSETNCHAETCVRLHQQIRTSMLLCIAGGHFQQHSFLLRHLFPIGENTSM